MDTLARVIGSAYLLAFAFPVIGSAYLVAFAYDRIPISDWLTTHLPL